MSHHYEDRSSESTFRDSRSHSQDNSEPPDLPMPTCFRSRSHSYLRAIQAGCSQDDDTASMDSGCSPPLTDTTVRTYSTSTGESVAQRELVNLLQIHLFDLINHTRWENGNILTMLQCYHVAKLRSECFLDNIHNMQVHICFGCFFWSLDVDHFCKVVTPFPESCRHMHLCLLDLYFP